MPLWQWMAESGDSGAPPILLDRYSMSWEDFAASYLKKTITVRYALTKVFPYPSLSSHRSAQRQERTAALLIICLFLQGFLSVLAVPSHANAGDGRYLVLCTPHGSKQVYVDRNGRVDRNGHADTPPSEQNVRPAELCPACVLHAQLALALPAALVTLQAVLLTVLSTLPVHDENIIPSEPQAQTSIRAPPFASL